MQTLVSEERIRAGSARGRDALARVRQNRLKVAAGVAVDAG
jgi:hypothetical protein